MVCALCRPPPSAVPPPGAVPSPPVPGAAPARRRRAGCPHRAGAVPGAGPRSLPGPSYSPAGAGTRLDRPRWPLSLAALRTAGRTRSEPGEQQARERSAASTTSSHREDQDLDELGVQRRLNGGLLRPRLVPLPGLGGVHGERPHHRGAEPPACPVRTRRPDLRRLAGLQLPLVRAEGEPQLPRLCGRRWRADLPPARCPGWHRQPIASAQPAAAPARGQLGPQLAELADVHGGFEDPHDSGCSAGRPVRRGHRAGPDLRRARWLQPDRHRLGGAGVEGGPARVPRWPGGAVPDDLQLYASTMSLSLRTVRPVVAVSPGAPVTSGMSRPGAPGPEEAAEGVASTVGPRPEASRRSRATSGQPRPAGGHTRLPPPLRPRTRSTTRLHGTGTPCA